MKDRISDVELAVKAIERANKIPLTYDEKELNRDSWKKREISRQSPTSVEIILLESERYQWKTKATLKINLNYLRPAILSISNQSAGIQIDSFPGFEYELKVSEPVRVKMLKIGVSDTSNNIIYFSRDDFKTSGNKVKFPMTATDIAEIKELQIADVE